MEIKWIDGWTTKGYKGYTITIPPKFSFETSNVFVNLKSNVAVIYGKNDSERSISKSVLFVDLLTNKIIKEDFPAKGNYYSKIHYSTRHNRMVLASSPVSKKGQAIIQSIRFYSREV